LTLSHMTYRVKFATTAAVISYLYLGG